MTTGVKGESGLELPKGASKADKLAHAGKLLQGAIDTINDLNSESDDEEVSNLYYGSDSEIDESAESEENSAEEQSQSSGIDYEALENIAARLEEIDSKLDEAAGGYSLGLTTDKNLDEQESDLDMPSDSEDEMFDRFTDDMYGMASNAAKPIVESESAMAAASAPLGVATTQIKYAPDQRVLSGHCVLACVGANWSGKGSTSVGSLQKMGNQIASWYTRLSGGALTFEVKAKSIKLNYPRHYKLVGKFEKTARASVKADRYILINSGAIKNSRGGGRSARMPKPASGTGAHELGHTWKGFKKFPFMLGHTGVYKIPKKVRQKNKKQGKNPNSTSDNLEVFSYSKYKLDRGKDGTSFMSTVASTRINGGQMYSVGYLNGKAYQHDVTDPEQVYKLGILHSKNNIDMKGVYIPNPKGGRPLFLSVDSVGKGDKNFITPMLHLISGGTEDRPVGGGTQRWPVLSSKTKEYEVEDFGLRFKNLGRDGDTFKIRIRPVA